MTGIADSNYVLNIYIQNMKVKKHICCIDQNHETCISFKFLEKVEFNLCVANDARLTSPCPCLVKFDKGKTCMFLMTAEMAKNANDMNLYMEVYQKMPCACLPSKLNLGNTKVDLSEQFTKVNAGESKPMQQYVSVKDTEGGEIAVVDMMIRVSKLNNINLNDFTMDDEGNNFMVKGNDDPHSYTFKRAAGHNMSSTMSMGQETGNGCCSDRVQFNKSSMGGGVTGEMWNGGWDEGFGVTGGGGTGRGCCGGEGAISVGGGGGGFTGTGGNETQGLAGTCSYPKGGCNCFVLKKTYDRKEIKVPKEKEPQKLKPSFFDYPRPVVAAVIAPAVKAPVVIVPAVIAPVALAPTQIVPQAVAKQVTVKAKPPPDTKIFVPISGMMAALPVRVPSPTVVHPPTVVPAPKSSPPQIVVHSPTVVPAPTVSPPPTVVPAPTGSPPPEPTTAPAPPQQPASSPENTANEDKPYVIRLAKRKSI